MIFAPFRYMLTGIIIGLVVSNMSEEYVIVRRVKYDRLKRKVKNEG